MPRVGAFRLFAVGVCQLFKGGQAALYLFGVDAVGKAHIALYPKAVAGHQQQVEFPGFPAEGVWKLEAPALVKCSNCGSLKLPHQACGNCGYYKGEEVIKKG